MRKHFAFKGNLSPERAYYTTLRKQTSLFWGLTVGPPCLGRALLLASWQAFQSLSVNKEDFIRNRSKPQLGDSVAPMSTAHIAEL